MSNLIIDEYGDKRWRNNEGLLHRVDGPAVEYANGGKKVWYLRGKKHRLDGPAIEWSDGTKHWIVNGQLHRLDGPAIEWADGDERWYINDVELSGPLKLLEYGAKLEDIAQYLTPREIAKCRTQKQIVLVINGGLSTARTTV